MISPIFQVVHTASTSKARSGILSLSRGQVHTPVFMPIGTQGTVKGLTAEDLLRLESQIILGNTYHLWLRPGLSVLERAGGLHSFSSWDRPILTDSGGFQAFSLSKIRKFTEEGVTFRSHLNGEKRFLSPEISMQIQTVIGSDIALVLDECLEAEVSQKEARRAMWRTRRWAERSQQEFERLRQQSGHQNLLFGIPQGAQFAELRKESALLTMELDFPGYSIGGVANGGEPEEVMYEQVLAQTEILESHKPRHLLGVGTPVDVVQMVARGIDMFDCVYPTRNARHGSVLIRVSDTGYQNLHIQNKRFEFDFTPINPDSALPELRSYTKSYLRHLIQAGEILGYRLATLQNLEFYHRLMSDIRTRLQNGSFDGWWPSFHRVVG